MNAQVMLPGRPFSGVIQVAGAHDLEEAQSIADAGVHALGIPLRLPVHEPDITEAEAKVLISALPPNITPVLITYETDSDSLVQLAHFLGVRHVQLHACLGMAGAVVLENIRRIDPGLFLIKSLVIGMCGMFSPDRELAACAPLVDAFITDTFDPQSGASGATGKTHDWSRSRRLVELSPRPVILAGGLTPDNVAQAIAAVRPAGVDAHTGLEHPGGRKSPELLQAFAARAREGFAGLGA